MVTFHTAMTESHFGTMFTVRIKQKSNSALFLIKHYIALIYTADIFVCYSEYPEWKKLEDKDIIAYHFELRNAYHFSTTKLLLITFNFKK